MPTSESNKRVLRLDPRDNALVALTDLRQGEHVNFDGEDYLLLSDVQRDERVIADQFDRIDVPPELAISRGDEHAVFGTHAKHLVGFLQGVDDLKVFAHDILEQL